CRRGRTCRTRGRSSAPVLPCVDYLHSGECRVLMYTRARSPPIQGGGLPATLVTDDSPPLVTRLCRMRAPSPKPLLEERVVVPIRRRAGTEKAERRAARPDLMPGAGRDQDRVARPDRLSLAVKLHLAGALEHEVDLFALPVEMSLRGAIWFEGGFGEALCCGVVKLANRRTVLRRERLRLCRGRDVHSGRLRDRGAQDFDH